MRNGIFVLTLAVGVFFISAVCNATAYHRIPVQSSLLQKTDAIDDFWSWFEKNEQRLRQFETNPRQYLTEVWDKAGKIREGLVIEFEQPLNGIINMTISANGDKELFPVVQAVVDKAPNIKGWNIIAFRQRIPLADVKKMRIKADGNELDPSQLKFFPLIEGKKLDIIVYVAGITEANFDKYAYAGLLLIDHILGEYDCVTKVRSYDFHEMPVSPQELQGLLPLPELARFVDGFHQSRK